MASSLNQPLLPVTAMQGAQFSDALVTEPVQTDSSILPISTSPASVPVTLHTATVQQPTPPLSSPTPTPPLPPQATATHDKGYLRRGFHRKLIDDTWNTIEDEVEPPVDVYDDEDTFPEHSATVQIVTFFMDDYVGQDKDIQAMWESPLTSSPAVRRALRQPQEPRTWRWVHCEGLHGPTMRVIAQETNWSLDKFAGIFSWGRASAEWADKCLLVHFQDQLTHIWMLYKEQPANPVFITCTKLNPDTKLKKRWENYVDFGDSRRELLLRKDPSLMLYCMMRAIIQDLRATAFTTPKELNELYDIAISQPSEDSLSHFYNLQQRLIQVTLSTTSLKLAATSLIKCVGKIRSDPTTISLVSQNTRDRLKDQMGLVDLFSDELPEVARELDAVASLAFNILAYSNNNLLRLLAVLTIAAVPLALSCAILAIDFEGRELTGQKITNVLCSVGAATIVGISIFWAFGPIKLWRLRRTQEDDGIRNPIPIRERIAEHRVQVRRAISQTSKRDSLNPDLHSPPRRPTILPGASPPPIAPQPRPPKLPRRSVTFSGLVRQPGSVV